MLMHVESEKEKFMKIKLKKLLELKAQMTTSASTGNVVSNYTY